MKKCKIIGLILCVAIVICSAFTACASTNTASNESQTRTFDGKEFKKLENEVIGKITTIDATNVVIQVATRKEMQKPEGNGNPPEMTEDMRQKMQNGEKPQEFNMDDFYTLTGETKTINIASADFGKEIDFKNFKPDENNTQNREDMMKNAKQKTYADYKVGDYVTIECTDSTYTVAKSVSNGGMMRMGGRPGMKDFDGFKQK